VESVPDRKCVPHSPRQRRETAARLRPRPPAPLAAVNARAPSAEAQPGWQHFVPAVLFLIVSVLAVMTMAAWPAPGLRQVAVMLRPGSDALQAEALAARVSGELVAVGGLPNVYIIAAERPDLVAALYHSGAWLVMNPLGAHGCNSAATNTYPGPGQPGPGQPSTGQPSTGSQALAAKHWQPNTGHPGTGLPA
jgi:hypothetical protein